MNYCERTLVEGQLRLTPAQGKIRSRLYQLGAIYSEEYADTGELLLDIRLPRQDFDRISKQEGLLKSCLVER